MADTLRRKILVVHAKASAGVSSKTGKPYQMLNVTFANTDTLSPCKDAANDDYGYSVITETLPYECKAALDIVPAYYDMVYEVSTTYSRNGNLVTGLKPVGIAYDSPVALDSAKK